MAPAGVAVGLGASADLCGLSPSEVARLMNFRNVLYAWEGINNGTLYLHRDSPLEQELESVIADDGEPMPRHPSIMHGGDAERWDTANEI